MVIIGRVSKTVDTCHEFSEFMTRSRRKFSSRKHAYVNQTKVWGMFKKKYLPIDLKTWKFSNLQLWFKINEKQATVAIYTIINCLKATWTKVCTEAVDIITKNVPLLNFPSDRIIKQTKLEIAYCGDTKTNRLGFRKTT